MMDDPNKDAYGESSKPAQLCSTCDHPPHKKGECGSDCYCIANMEVRPRTGLGDGPPNSILRGRCGREFTTLCNLPEGHRGSCSWVPQLTEKPSERYAVYFAGEFICKLDDYIDRVKSDWEIVRCIAEPPPLTPEGECKAFEIIISEQGGFMGLSFEREAGTQIFKHPFVQAAWEGWQLRSQTSGHRLCARPPAVGKP